MNKTLKKEKITLKAIKRDILGKQTRSLRKSGTIPANIFGKNFKSLAVSINNKEFLTTYKESGETNVVFINVENKEIPTLISQIQIHPIDQSILHIDFRKIDLKQKIEAKVPIAIIGTSEAVERKNGVLLSQMTEINIFALPADIPNKIEIDITPLTDIGNSIRIADLPKSNTFEIKEDPTKTIVLVTEHKEEELEPETVSEEPEIISEEGKLKEEIETDASTNPEQKQESKPKDEKKSE